MGTLSLQLASILLEKRPEGKWVMGAVRRMGSVPAHAGRRAPIRLQGQQRRAKLECGLGPWTSFLCAAQRDWMPPAESEDGSAQGRGVEACCPFSTMAPCGQAGMQARQP